MANTKGNISSNSNNIKPLKEKKERIDIDIEKIRSSYIYLKQYYCSQLTQQETIDKLHNKSQFQKKSAKMYVESFTLMLRGEGYLKKMNALAIEYYLENINNDFEEQVLNKSIKSIKTHIESNKSPNKRIKQIIESYNK